MPIINFSRRRNEVPASHPRIAMDGISGTGEQGGGFVDSENPSADDSRRRLKILDFYNRKTVAHRNTVRSLRGETSEAPPLPPRAPPLPYRSRPGLNSSFSDPSPLLPYPSHQHQETRTPWSCRHPILSERNDLPMVHEASQLSIGNIMNPVGSFVILQPAFMPLQAMDREESNLRIRQHGQEHLQVTRSITLPESLVSGGNYFLNQTEDSSISLEDEIDDNEEIGDDDAKVPDILSEDATCSICSNVFRDPRILRCGHTFCLRCLIRMHGRSNQHVLVCPICREQTFLASNNLRFLTKNFAVKNLVETIKFTSKNDLEKLFKDQSDQCSGGKNKVFDSSRTQLTEVHDRTALRRTKTFPLKDAKVAGLEFMKQKFYLLFEKSNSLHILSTKSFLMGSAKRGETIVLEGVTNPLSVTSRESRSSLFILETSTAGKRGIFKTSVWKVVFPDGKQGSRLKTTRWTESLQTGKDIKSVSGGLMVVLLVHGEGKFSLEFYPTEGDFGKPARTIPLQAISRPVGFTKVFDGSRVAIAHLSAGHANANGKSKLSLSVVNMDGLVLKSIDDLGDEDDLLTLTSDGVGSVFVVRRSRRNEILRLDGDLEGPCSLELNEKVDEVVRAMAERKLAVCHERKLNIYEY